MILILQDWSESIRQRQRGYLVMLVSGTRLPCSLPSGISVANILKPTAHLTLKKEILSFKIKTGGGVGGRQGF